MPNPGTIIAVDVRQIPRIDHAEGMRLAVTEYQRVLDLVRSLGPNDWSQPTDCTEWTVKDIVVHLIGAAEGMGSLRELVHQARAAGRLPGTIPIVDRINRVQVSERRGLAVEQLADRLAQAFERGLRGRRRWPALIRMVPVPADEFGRMPFGLLTDVIYTRDAFVHRVDISRATGKPMVVTADHEGRIVADVARDWAGRHQSAFILHLIGPSGGTYISGTGGQQIDLDGIEFCRIVSGRAPGDGLLQTRVMF